MNISLRVSRVVRPGTKYRDVGNEIQRHATANGCSVVRSYCGHGIHKYIDRNEHPHLIFSLDSFIVHQIFLTMPVSISPSRIQSIHFSSSVLENKAIGVMKPGHSFTIEPMINAGMITESIVFSSSTIFSSPGIWRDILWNDNWTSVTEDGQRSAQFEHTFLVTDTGCDTLTARSSGQPWFLDGNIS